MTERMSASKPLRRYCVRDKEGRWYADGDAAGHPAGLWSVRADQALVFGSHAVASTIVSVRGGEVVRLVLEDDILIVLDALRELHDFSDALHSPRHAIRSRAAYVAAASLLEEYGA